MERCCTVCEKKLNATAKPLVFQLDQVKYLYKYKQICSKYGETDLIVNVSNHNCDHPVHLWCLFLYVFDCNKVGKFPYPCPNKICSATFRKIDERFTKITPLDTYGKIFGQHRVVERLCVVCKGRLLVGTLAVIIPPGEFETYKQYEKLRTEKGRRNLIANVSHSTVNCNHPMHLWCLFMHMSKCDKSKKSPYPCPKENCVAYFCEIDEIIFTTLTTYQKEYKLIHPNWSLKKELASSYNPYSRRTCVRKCA